MAGKPNNVAANAVSPKWVVVTWDPIVSEADWTIAIWREPGYKALWPQGWLTETAFTDQAAEPDTDYTYRVCVKYEGDTKSYCAPTKVKTPPATASTPNRPTPSVTDHLASPRSITIRWNGHHDYSNYEIVLGRGGVFGGIQELDGGTTGSYTAVPLVPDTEYHFAVRGVSSLWGLSKKRSGWSTRAVVRTAPPLNLPWHPWFPVTDKPEDPNHAKFSTATPPVALARDAEHQDLFVMGTDGRVWTTYWSLGDRGWHPWFPITDDPSQHTIATFSKGTAPAALARDPQHQDLFVMGTDQRIWTSYWAG